MKRGLVLEGGAMRGLFSAGVTDALMDAGLLPDGIVGVSAGAAFGCNVKSGQRGRAIRYNKRFARDPRYCGLRSLLTSGDLFNARFAYHRVPEEFDRFDTEAFDRSPMAYYVVCTDVDTGRPLYHRCDRGGHRFYEWVRASASMPLASRIVDIDGRRLLDGGVSDSIPLRFFESEGYDRNVVVTTQPADYRKMPLSLLPLMRLRYRRYPRFVEAMARRHVMYNEQLDYLARREAEGACLTIRPDSPVPIGHLSHDPAEMQRAYDMGLDHGRRAARAVARFWRD